MNYTVEKQLPIEAIIKQYPLNPHLKQKVLEDRAEIQAILNGKSSKLLIILGPCSAWPSEAVLHYADRLVDLNKKLHNKFKFVMRLYTQKSRTRHGWQGPLYQPNPLARPDLEAGLHYSREMMLAVLAKGLPLADEVSLMHHTYDLLPLLSWAAIGARSSENPGHRIFASALDCPVGIKNPTHGSLIIAMNSVAVAQEGHVTFFENQQVKTVGNPYAHLVLRGGNKMPNYSTEHLTLIQQLMNQHSISNPSVLIDASHDNCIEQGKKNPALQIRVIEKVMEQLKTSPQLKPLIKGFMLESFIKEGQQPMDAPLDRSGISITDPCLSWVQTENFLMQLASGLSI